VLRELNQQKYCGWCGSEVLFEATWMSRCKNCKYKRYINPNPCSGIIINLNDSVLLVKRAIEPGLGAFDFPGGFMDMSDNSMEDATYRELSEELGLNKTDIDKLEYFDSALSSYTWQDTRITNLIFFYTCTVIDEEKDIVVDTSENSELLWVKEKDFEKINFAWEVDRKMFLKYFKDRK
jgi:NAD+ diphosphatase